MSPLPLVSHTCPGQIIAWYRADGAVTLRQFLADVSHLAAAVSPRESSAQYVQRSLPLFSVGLAAAIVAGKVSLLPSTHTPEMVRQMQVFAPDVFCLTTATELHIDLPQLAIRCRLMRRQADICYPAN